MMTTANITIGRCAASPLFSRCHLLQRDLRTIGTWLRKRETGDQA